MAKKDDRVLLDLVQNHATGRYQAISDAMQKGGSPFQPVDSGLSAVQSAIDSRDIRFIETLIEHPAVNFDYAHALQYALKTKNGYMSNSLVMQAERQDAKFDTSSLDTPMHTVLAAHEYGDFSLFCRIVDLCETPNTYDWNGEFLIAESAKWSDDRYFEHLITVGGDVCLPVNKYAGEEENPSVLETLARDPKQHSKLNFVLEQCELPFADLEKAFYAARHNGSENNVKLLQEHSEDLQWEFDPEWPSRVTRYTPKFMPERSLTEIFNFESKHGERISILKNTVTEQEAITRQSFSQIDDKETLAKAAEQLEKFGGQANPKKDADSPVLKTRPAVKTVRKPS